MPAEALAEALRRAGPGRARRPGGVHPARPDRPPRAAPHRRHHRRSCPAAPSPSAGCRSSGSGCTCPAACAVYPSSVVMNVVPAQEAGRRWHRRHLAAAEGVRRAAAPDHPRRLRPARRRRGVRGRRRPGHRDVRVRHRGVPPGQPGHRPRQHLRRRRQAPAQGPDRHRRRGRAHRDRGPRRRHRRPGARRRRPDQPGRARHAGRRRAGHRLRRAGRRGRERAGGAGRRHQAPRADHRGAGRPAVRRSCSSTRSTQGLARRRRLRAPSTWRSRPRTPPPSPPGSATPARSSSARTPRSRSATTAPGSNHVLPTGGCACHSSGLSVQSFLRGIHVVDYTRDALAEVAHHVVTLAEAEDLPAHGAALQGAGSTGRSRRASEPARDPASTTCPSGTSCAASPRTARRSSTCPVRLNTNENPYPLPEPLVRRIAERVDRGRPAAQPLPGPGRGRAAHRAGRATSTAPPATGSPRARCGPPTAPTRSSSSCCRPSAAPAAPPSASSRRTRCTR